MTTAEMGSPAILAAEGKAYARAVAEHPAHSLKNH
jgi:hypothetical protein